MRCMKMRIVLEQRQKLKMVMTTELRQAIELLQLSNYELKSFIEKKVEENPFIELVEKDLYERDSTYYYRKHNNDEEVDPLDFVTKEEKSLDEHLLRQVNLLPIDEEEQVLLRFLVLNINESGYLTMSNEEISHFLNVDLIDVENARDMLLTLEPLGIGARNLQESL